MDCGAAGEEERLSSGVEPELIAELQRLWKYVDEAESSEVLANH